ncbi:MAG: dipicolinate synthase subunit B [Acutalibacteraceae bacterium]|nr:dipicolinate synthase subunit B [Acutalibacteraceae bacterium]
MSKLRVGFALCGSFCTFKKVIPIIQQLADNGAEIYPIMSQTAAYTNTRFGSSVEFRELIETICNKEIITTIEQAEPIGPRKLLDILIVEPCTGNTLGKLANGITDTSVTMAVKAHLRNERPVLIAVSTNDGLTASAKNIGKLQNSKNIFFVPYTQDDAYNKPASLVADFDKTMVAMHLALEGKQIQPLLIK